MNLLKDTKKKIKSKCYEIYKVQIITDNATHYIKFTSRKEMIKTIENVLSLETSSSYTIKILKGLKYEN